MLLLLLLVGWMNSQQLPARLPPPRLKLPAGSLQDEVNASYINIKRQVVNSYSKSHFRREISCIPNPLHCLTRINLKLYLSHMHFEITTVVSKPRKKPKSVNKEWLMNKNRLVLVWRLLETDFVPVVKKMLLQCSPASKGRTTFTTFLNTTVQKQAVTVFNCAPITLCWRHLILYIAVVRKAKAF